MALYWRCWSRLLYPNPHQHLLQPQICQIYSKGRPQHTHHPRRDWQLPICARHRHLSHHPAHHLLRQCALARDGQITSRVVSIAGISTVILRSYAASQTRFQKGPERWWSQIYFRISQGTLSHHQCPYWQESWQITGIDRLSQSNCP